MKKYLIWTALVLAAITACNKEVEAPVVDNGQEEATPGKVTLTFTAAICEETRTAYDDEQNPDQKARWVLGDKITVCVSNNDSDNPEYKTAVFEATTETATGMEFTGQVQTGYTTIVSGVYPANSQHVFTAGAVTSVYLSDTYDLGTANDGGTAIPMVGAMDENDNFVFHHICGALKIEVIDIFNALTFTTAGEAITGSFPLTNGRIAIPANGSASTVTFNYDRLSTNPTLGERYNRTFYVPIPDGTLTAGATMALKKRNNNNTLTTAYEKTTTGSIQFSSNVIKRLPAIELSTPAEWSITVNEVDAGSPFSVIYSAPSGTRFIRSLLSVSSWENTYNRSVAQFIEKNILGNNGYTTSYTYTPTNNIETYYGTNRIMIMCGYKMVSGARQATLEYCSIDYSFEEPTQEYLSWIGKWGLVDSNNKTDTWTIARKHANHTYTVTGLCNNTSNPKKVEALFNNGKLKFMSQYDLATVKFSGDDNIYYISLVGYNQNTSNVLYNSYQPYNLMEASLNPDGTASLIGAEHTFNNTTFVFSRYNLLYRADHTASLNNYGSSRYLPATMTRVTEE